MLLDCAKLTRDGEQGFRELFARTRDYSQWVCLKLEDPNTIGVLEPEWNDFDRLTPATQLLHTTRRMTQPWKTGLPVDWCPGALPGLSTLGWLMRARRKLSASTPSWEMTRHPDANQEVLFFGLLKECLAQGAITEEELRQEMAVNHLRHDAFEVLERTPDLARPQPPLAPSA